MLVNKFIFMKDVVAQWEHAGLASQSSAVRDSVGEQQFSENCCNLRGRGVGVWSDRNWGEAEKSSEVGNMYMLGKWNCNFKRKRKFNKFCGMCHSLIHSQNQ